MVKLGGRLVIVDYHRPRRTHPLYYPMIAVLRILKPYALELWRHEISAWLPRAGRLEKTTLFGGLYQILRVTV